MKNTLKITLKPGLSEKEPRVGKVTKLFEKVFQTYLTAGQTHLKNFK